MSMFAIAPAAAAALIATVPASGLALLAGDAAERLFRDPRLREALWRGLCAVGLLVPAAVLWLPPLPLSAAEPASHVLGPQSPLLSAATDVEAWMAPAIRSLPDLSAAAFVFLLSCTAAALIRLIRFALGAARLRSIVKRSRPFDRPDFAAALAARMGGDAPSVRLTGEIEGPVLAGFLHPLILLPRGWSETVDITQLVLVCAHEAAHARRGDNLRLPVESAAASLLWFNPFAGACLRRLAAAREEVCDATALADEPAYLRRAYCRILIEAFQVRAGPELQTSFIGARRTAAMRLRNILDPAHLLGRRPARGDRPGVRRPGRVRRLRRRCRALARGLATDRTAPGRRATLHRPVARP
jgi:beta-lactamase regulating signal transducer with metallopeptidase domain